MAAIKPEIIKDAHALISLYQTNPSFRERFDMAINRSVDVTYKHRPLKLYFEVLASTNRAKYGEAYKDIRRIVRHDREGIIKKTLLGVTPKDLSDLTIHARQAEKNINSTDYPTEEINKINKIEETTKDLNEKQNEHKKRLEETEYLAAPKKTPEEIEQEEERPVLKAAPMPEKAAITHEKEAREEKPTKILAGPSGEPIRNIVSEQPLERIPEEVSFEERAPEEAAPSIPQVPSLGFAKRIVKTGEAAETAGVETGTRFAAGRAAAAGAARAGAAAAGGGAQAAARLGVGAATRAGAGLIAKLGFSAATGLATGGVGLVVGLAITAITTFGDQIKSLAKLILQVMIAIALASVLMLVWGRGERMNALVPPYTVGEAAELPTVTPTPSIPVTPTPTGPTSTPAPGVTATCPVSGGGISCGSFGTNYYACPGGHCSPSYRAANPGLCETYPATAYGMDILASAGQAVLIPTIKDPVDGAIKNIECSFVYQEVGMQGQSINQFNCVITGSTSGNHFYIQFHHLRPTVPPGPYRTGSIAGYVWSAGDHTHVQIGLNGACQGPSTSPCVSPEQYLQCR